MKTEIERAVSTSTNAWDLKEGEYGEIVHDRFPGTQFAGQVVFKPCETLLVSLQGDLWEQTNRLRVKKLSPGDKVVLTIGDDK